MVVAVGRVVVRSWFTKVRLGGMIVGVSPMLSGDSVEFRPTSGVLGRGHTSCGRCASV